MTDPSPVTLEKQRQRQAALEKANQQRKAIKAMRTGLRAGVVDELGLLRGDEDPKYEALIASWPIERVLRLMHYIGPARAYEVLTWGHVSPRRKVSDLTFAKRAELARLVEDARKEIRVEL